MEFRIEKDSLGEVQVPVGALYGAQTQRALANFQFSGRQMPGAFIRHLGAIKAAAAMANQQAGVLDPELAERIYGIGREILGGAHSEAFPVEVFQTGSGTSTNMNMNEVIANLAGAGIHPNDHVNLSQSSNDVIPSVLQVSAAQLLRHTLLPALQALEEALVHRGAGLDDAVKTGRTHLMDAMPVTIGQELRTWAAQLAQSRKSVAGAHETLLELPLGGTAVGTGVNVPPGYTGAAINALNDILAANFSSAPDKAANMAGQLPALGAAAALKGVVVALHKIANDLRWMSSGPLAGLGEITLPALQPGSSIMPGKVNPVIPEAIAMICVDVIGSETTITLAAQSGNFQLNVMLPLIAEKLLSAIDLTAGACRALVPVIEGFEVRSIENARVLAANPILVTALAPEIGYDRAALIAKEAYARGEPVLDAALRHTELDRETLVKLLDPARLTRATE